MRKMLFTKIKKEAARFKKRLFKKHFKQTEINKYRLENQAYEDFAKSPETTPPLEIPIIKSSNETVSKIIHDRCSLARFGDGEFRVMKNRGIRFQSASPELVKKLDLVLNSNKSNLLLALPDCFGSLEDYRPKAADFWRKWLVAKRPRVYASLDMERSYYNAFFSRAYMIYNKTEQHYINCQTYFENIKQIWAGRDVIICEGENTRFGLFNDLLDGANSISRILCPARNAYDKYDDILSAFENINNDKLVLIALGPTATVLVYDLHGRGFQAIDIGHLDVEYGWFLHKDDEKVRPSQHKYVDAEDRRGHQFDSAEYHSQIIYTIL